MPLAGLRPGREPRCSDRLWPDASLDTAPDRVQGSGYQDGDDSISGFSLTHLSGARCPIFGDVPILPVTGAVRRTRRR